MTAIDPDAVRAAASLVRDGIVVPLNLPLTVHLPKRPAPVHEMLEHQSLRPMPDGRFAVVNDDRLTLSMQGSTHWDALGHFGVLETGRPDVYFGGRELTETSAGGQAATLGIGALPAAIVTRGVVLDLVASMGFADTGWLPPDARVGVDEVQRCLDEQDVRLRRGDVVALYTGFENRLEASGGAFPAATAGLDVTTRRLWAEHGTAGLVCDTHGLEPVPADFAVHAALLKEDGMALGEMWALRELAATARRLRRFEFFLTSVPLAMPGLYGSPANAVAVF